MNARMDAAGYTTSGRNGGKSSAKKVAPKARPAKKAAPSKKSAPKSRFADEMNVPGSARPRSPADSKLLRQRSIAASKNKPASVPPFGRDRFGPKKTAGQMVARPATPQMPAMSRQEREAKIMSEMRKRRLGPGQR